MKFAEMREVGDTTEETSARSPRRANEDAPSSKLASDLVGPLVHRPGPATSHPTRKQPEMPVRYLRVDGEPASCHDHNPQPYQGTRISFRIQK